MCIGAHLFDGAADSTVANIGIDLDQEVAADHGGFQLLMPLVGRDDGSPPRHLRTIGRMIVCFVAIMLLLLKTDKFFVV